MIAFCTCISSGMEITCFLLGVISASAAWLLLTLLGARLPGEKRPTPDLRDRHALVLFDEQGGRQSHCLVLWLTGLSFTVLPPKHK